MCVLSHFSRVWLFVAPWTVARQATVHEIFQQEYWSVLPCPFPRIFLTQGLNLCLLSLQHWQAGSLPAHLWSCWLLFINTMLLTFLNAFKKWWWTDLFKVPRKHFTTLYFPFFLMRCFSWFLSMWSVLVLLRQVVRNYGITLSSVRCWWSLPLPHPIPLTLLGRANMAKSTCNGPPPPYVALFKLANKVVLWEGVGNCSILREFRLQGTADEKPDVPCIMGCVCVAEAVAPSVIFGTVSKCHNFWVYSLSLGLQKINVFVFALCSLFLFFFFFFFAQKNKILIIRKIIYSVVLICPNTWLMGFSWVSE